MQDWLSEMQNKIRKTFKRVCQIQYTCHMHNITLLNMSKWCCNIKFVWKILTFCSLLEPANLCFPVFCELNHHKLLVWAMNHLYNLNRVECHCLLYKFSWTDKIRVDNLVCDFKGTWSGRGLSIPYLTL